MHKVATERFSDVIERAKKSSAAIVGLYKTLQVVQQVLAENRFDGTDQNPKGIHDLVGSALLTAKRDIINFEGVE